MDQVVDIGVGVVEVAGDADVAVFSERGHGDFDSVFLLQSFLQRVDASVSGFEIGLFWQRDDGHRSVPPMAFWCRSLESGEFEQSSPGGIDELVGLLSESMDSVVFEEGDGIGDGQPAGGIARARPGEFIFPRRVAS